jgi:predicted RNase H-like HicB family nuclease
MLGHVILTFRVHQEDGPYVATCDELELASCGDTIQAAFAAIEDATLLYLRVLEDEGERERVFAERKVQIHPGAPTDHGEEIAVRARLDEYVSPHIIAIPAIAA